ncbi:MAG TPA: YiiX/YebB-like N1pC/P60 family cysteine hydrolase [Anaeromyxobacter sp.]|nr:YiiX/YebB-like N1pC/P60 family cysteine hydrolase [Anaeromyxobacter sp.]
MSRRCVVVWLLVLGLAVSSPTRAAEPAVRAGDLVFETSSSSQSWAIRWATRSPWSHVGIVDVAADGTYVVEALGKVSRTPWRAWRRRARRGGDLLVLRPRGVPAPLRAAAVERAKAFLGRRYDPRFGWGDDRIYCSELVVKAYERAAGVSLGRRERLGDLRTLGMRGAMEERWGGPVPEDLVLVTPASIAEDRRLERVYEGRP